MAHRFVRFGEIETRDSSPLYSRLALIIAADADLLALAEHCMPGQPAPNLFLGAVHYLLLRGDPLGAALASYYPSLVPAGAALRQDHQLAAVFRNYCLAHANEIVGLLRTRRVQTNEVGRCAALLPAFTLASEWFGAPLFLAEIGASAGLNLLFDCYGYTYFDERGGVVARTGDAASPVQLATELRGLGRPALPGVLPKVAGRVGIDLNPVDLRDDDAVAWLRALIWPEHADRVHRLLAAVKVARADPPPLLAGDALELLPAALAMAPNGALLVVIHTFTLNQFPEHGRQHFLSLLRDASQHRDVVEVGVEMLAGTAYARLTLTHYSGSRVAARDLGLCDGHVRQLRWSA